MQKRLSYIELQWPYFLGFGLVLSLLTSTPLLSPFGGGETVLRHTVGNIVLGYKIIMLLLKVILYPPFFSNSFICRTCVFALAFPLMILASFNTSPPQIE